jgi:hypothetical protein
MHSLKKSVKPEIVHLYDLWVLRHKIGGWIKFKLLFTFQLWNNNHYVLILKKIVIIHLSFISFLVVFIRICVLHTALVVFLRTCVLHTLWFWNEHIVQKPLSEMYTSHSEHVWSSTFQQQQQKPTDLQHITKYFSFKFYFIFGCIYPDMCIAYSFGCISPNMCFAYTLVLKW